MIIFYLMALIPIIVGAVLWVKTREVNWIEFVGGSVCAFLIAGIMHFAAYKGLTGDVQTYSGQVTQVRQYSAWLEYFETPVYRTEYYTDTEYSTDSKGKRTSRTVRKSRQVFDHWQPATRNHSEYWQAYSNIDSTYDINKPMFLNLSEKFGRTDKVRGDRSTMEHNSRMIGGDPYDYVADNHTGYMKPVTKTVSWENMVKGAGPSTFSFKKVPENVAVYEWPANDNPWSSNRVLNAPIDVYQWDSMNARLGPTKKVNVIIAYFKGESEDIAELQRSKVLGGKKNDLWLCYGDGWVMVFGWTKSELVKSNLKTILLENPVNNAIIPLIEEEIRRNYEVREFEKDFAYIGIQPRGIHIFIAALLMILTQGGFWYWSYNNTTHKIGQY